MLRLQMFVGVMGLNWEKRRVSVLVGVGELVKRSGKIEEWGRGLEMVMLAETVKERVRQMAMVLVGLVKLVGLVAMHELLDTHS